MATVAEPWAIRTTAVANQANTSKTPLDKGRYQAFELRSVINQDSAK
jgi:hypothetical protein